MNAPLPDYATPPLIEVVCGISFAPLEGFRAVDLGLFWQTLGDEFPQVEEHAPVASVLEKTGPAGPEATVQFLDTQPLPRVWFVDKSGNGLMQVQNDLFLYNWRKLSPTDEYPRYSAVWSKFVTQLDQFEAYIRSRGLGEIKPLQYELTYINHMVENECWTGDGDMGQLFPDFRWRAPPRFLPTYEAVNWRSTFRLPETNGRLHISIQNGLRRTDKQPVLILELKARGFRPDSSREGMARWFELAREWIVRGFTDVTSDQSQRELWARRA